MFHLISRVSNAIETWPPGLPKGYVCFKGPKCNMVRVSCYRGTAADSWCTGGEYKPLSGMHFMEKVAAPAFCQLCFSTRKSRWLYYSEGFWIFGVTITHHQASASLLAGLRTRCAGSADVTPVSSHAGYLHSALADVSTWVNASLINIFLFYSLFWLPCPVATNANVNAATTTFF